MATPGGLLAAIFLILALYCSIDPFKHSPIYGFSDFETFKVDLPPWSEVPAEKDAENLLQKSEIKFLNQIQGPESLAFDPLGRGPYTGVADGRIVFWDGFQWSDFAYTSSNRSDICDPKPSPLSHWKNEHICGRPLGLRFDQKTGDLYIADAYFGLMKVGPEGGLATSLTTEAEGIPMRFTNDLDIDDEGNIYFTDSSAKYQRRNFMQLSFSGENSGRFLKYNPITRETTVILRNLQFPNGVSLSKDHSFIVVCEGSIGRIESGGTALAPLRFDPWNISSRTSLYLCCYSSKKTYSYGFRLRKHWLKGEKAGTSEVLAIVPGYPDNIRTNKEGNFWVAVHCRRSIFTNMFAAYQRLRKFILRLPISAKFQYLLGILCQPQGVAIKYSPEGKILQILEDSEGKVLRAISEVEERDGKLWMGSVLMPFIGVYELS